VGFDIESSKVYDPNATYDFMSYCTPWISPYNYVELKNAITTVHAAALPQDNVEREHLFLVFRVYLDGTVELLPSFQLRTQSVAQEGLGPSPVYCDLLDEGEQVILSHRCQYSNPYQDPEGRYVVFREQIPWEPSIRSIAFRRNGEVTATIEIEEQPPEVNIEAVDRTAETATIHWSGTHPDTDRNIVYAVRYSNDGGQTWEAIAANLSATSYTADLNLLPGGEECRFQVVASAGIRTALAETDAFPVKQKARRAHILSPDPGATVTQGEPVVLRGGGFSPDVGTPGLDNVV
jgi:hypothetical protein